MCTECNQRQVMARGLCGICYARWWRANNPEKRKAAQKRQDARRVNDCESCGGPTGSHTATYCMTCYNELKKARAHESEEQTKQNALQSARNWYYNHREYAQAKHKEWLEKNKDKVKQYEIDHVDERRAYVETRRARRQNQDGGLTVSDWLVLLDFYEHKCVYCLEAFDNLEQDHVIPLSLGGKHSLENVVPACLPCNRHKGSSIMIPKHPNYIAVCLAVKQENSTTPV